MPTLVIGPSTTRKYCVDVKCQRCGAIRTAENRRNRIPAFCRDCIRTKDRVHLTCPVCSKEWSVKKSHAPRTKYCSKACEAVGYRDQMRNDSNPNWRGGDVVVKCQQCERDYKVRRSVASRAKCCSRSCLSSYRSVLMKGRPNPIHKKRVTRPKPDKAPKPSRSSNLDAKTYTGNCPKCNVRRKITKGCDPLCQICRREGKQPIKPCLLCNTPRSWNGTSGICSRCYRSSRLGASNPNWKGGITPANKKLRASPEYKAWRIAVFERDSYTCQKCGQVGWTLHAHHLIPFSADPEFRLEVSNGQTLCEPCHRKTDSFLGKAKTWGKSRLQRSFSFAVERPVEWGEPDISATLEKLKQAIG